MYKIKVKKFSSAPMQENTYVIYSTLSNQGYIIDPGSSPKEVLDFINSNNINIKAILNTHGHFDHITYNQYFIDKLNIPIVLFDDKNIYCNDFLKYERYYNPKPILLKEYKIYDKEIYIDQFKVKIIKTPGHTPGGVSFYIKELNIIFVGDTLFKDSFGRFDFIYSNFEDLKKSLNILFSLPKDTKVFCGHGEDTTIKRESVYNPIFSYT